MKSIRVVQAMTLVASLGLALAAGANDKDGPLLDPAAIPAPVVQMPPVDPKQTAWEAKETELIKLLKETIRGIVKQTAPDRNANWDLVEANLKKLIFSKVKSEGEVTWPATQAAWVESAYDSLDRSEMHTGEKFKRQRELEVLEAFNARMSQLAKEAKPDTADDKVAKPEEDDTPWRYLDKNGSRTTKPRHKGQEPLN